MWTQCLAKAQLCGTPYCTPKSLLHFAAAVATWQVYTFGSRYSTRDVGIQYDLHRVEVWPSAESHLFLCLILRAGIHVALSAIANHMLRTPAKIYIHTIVTRLQTFVLQSCSQLLSSASVVSSLSAQYTAGTDITASDTYGLGQLLPHDYTIYQVGFVCLCFKYTDVCTHLRMCMCVSLGVMKHTL